MTTGLISLSILATILLISLLYLVTTQRSDHHKTMERMTESSLQQANTMDSTLRLIIQSSNSQSADMTDLVTKTTAKWSELMELMTLGREQPMPSSSEIVLTEQERQSLREPSDNEMPLHIQEALAREREAEEMMLQQPSKLHLPSHLNRQEFASEMNGHSEVEITPL